MQNDHTRAQAALRAGRLNILVPTISSRSPLDLPILPLHSISVTSIFGKLQVLYDKLL